MTKDELKRGKLCRHGNLIEALTEWSQHCCQNIEEINCYKHSKNCNLIMPPLVWIKLDDELSENEAKNKRVADDIEIETIAGNRDLDDIDECFQNVLLSSIQFDKEKMDDCQNHDEEYDIDEHFLYDGLSEIEPENTNVADDKDLEAKAMISVSDDNDEFFQNAVLSSPEFEREGKIECKPNYETEFETKNAVDDAEQEAKAKYIDLDDNDVCFQFALLSSIEFEHKDSAEGHHEEETVHCDDDGNKEQCMMD